jgi:hypothetical protein
MKDRPIRVHIVCTGRRTHRRTHLASGYLHRGEFTWKNSLVEIFAGQVWKGEHDYAGDRYRFPTCPRCGLRAAPLRADTLAPKLEALATAMHRERTIVLDLSLLG